MKASQILIKTWLVFIHVFAFASGIYAAPPASPYIIVLGIAQDAGFPQAHCRKECCKDAWLDPAQRRYTSSLGLVDPDTGQRWIFDATPDFKYQLQIVNQGQAAPDIISGIFLTHGHIGHYTGLMHVGHEVMGASGINVFAMPRMRKYLSTSGPWDQLVRYKNITLQPLADGIPVELSPNLRVTPFLVPHRDEYTETVGYKIQGPEKTVVFIPDIDKWKKWHTPIESIVAKADRAFLDGSFYQNGEIPGRDMASIAHPFIVESMDRFKDLPASEKQKIYFIHLNHTNPALLPGSEARQKILEAGFRLAEQEKIFKL